MSGAFTEWQPRYAEYGIATFPVKDKRPCVKGWQRIGLNYSSRLAIKFQEVEAFGFQCGRRSGITVIDIDTPDKGILLEAMKMFGESPLMWRTGSGNYAIAYRHNGEGRRIRPFHGLPIDILGDGGYAVLPPSQGAKRRYEFVIGSIEALAALPLAHPAASKSSRRERIPKGQRANTLFDFALDQARHVDGLESLLDVVRTRNLDCEEPLPDTEVVKTAASAWGYEQRGENLKGRGGAMVIPHAVADVLIDHDDAWRLYGKLRRHHWGRDFVLSKPMASAMGWDVRRWRKARDMLAAFGLIVCIHPGGAGRGDPPIYSWAMGCNPTPQ